MTVVRNAKQMVSTKEFLALAICAFMKNNQKFVKKDSEDKDKGILSNFSIINDLFENGEKPKSVHYDIAQNIIDHFSNVHLINSLTDSLNDFDESIYQIISENETPRYNIGKLAYVPVKYFQDKGKEVLKQKSEFFGKEKEKVSIKIKILSSFFSDKFGCMYVSAEDENKNAIDFFSQKSWKVKEIYNVTAKVKNHFERGGTKITRLNYVKVKIN